MMSLLFFLGVAILLTVEGRWIIAFIMRGNLTMAEEWALGFPLGAFINALLFFACTVFGVPLSAAAVFGGHLVVVAVAFVVSLRVAQPIDASIRSVVSSRVILRSKIVSRDTTGLLSMTLLTLLTLAILIKLFYGISHALLPSYSYDTVSQWNMRAKISYEDQAIAFDRDETRGMSKPQYPILLHSLQILFNLPRDEWSDVAANGSTLMLTLTGFLAFFLLIRRLIGSFGALLVTAFILTIPILSIHLAQGYGDIHVLEYMLLSAALFLGRNQRNQGNQGKQREETSLLLLSAIFVAASAWVKQEGLVFGVAPWILILLASSTKTPRCQDEKTPRLQDSKSPKSPEIGLESWNLGILEPLRLVIIALLLSLSWSFLLLLKGLPLSPHGGGDLTIGWHPEGIPLVLKALFAGGSFGIHWYLVIGLLLFVFFERASSARAERASREASRLVPHRAGLARREPTLILLWGGIAFFGVLFIFLCTSNIEFLINAQTFSRTMLLSLALLILGVVMTIEDGGAGVSARADRPRED